MTIRVDAAELATAVEVASWVGSLVAMLVAVLIIYLMVRPSRRRRREAGRAPEDEAIEMEEMLRLMERMEQRLEVLERVVAHGANDEDRILDAGEGPQIRRVK